MSNNKQSQKELKNSLYDKLKKDLKKMGNREYIPVVLFKNLEKKEPEER